MADDALPKSRKEAKAAGHQRYFTGTPCRNGHIDHRLTSNGTCMACARSIQTGVYKRNAIKRRAQVAEYRKANIDRVRKRDQEYGRRNAARLSEYRSARYRKKKDHIIATIEKYRRARPGFTNEIKKAYVLRKSRAMPPWADRATLRAVYAEAERLTKMTGVRHSVDHIYPLKGKDSCGLHLPWNLQIIPHIDNCRKGTKHPDEWRRLSESGTT